jgi:hypothetical protein
MICYAFSKKMGGSWCDSVAAIASITTQIKSGTVTVAGKPSIDVPPGTLNSALKQAGLKE